MPAILNSNSVDGTVLTDCRLFFVVTLMGKKTEIVWAGVCQAGFGEFPFNSQYQQLLHTPPSLSHIHTLIIVL